MPKGIEMEDEQVIFIVMVGDYDAIVRVLGAYPSFEDAVQNIQDAYQITTEPIENENYGFWELGGCTIEKIAYNAPLAKNRYEG